MKKTKKNDFATYMFYVKYKDYKNRWLIIEKESLHTIQRFGLSNLVSLQLQL